MSGRTKFIVEIGPLLAFFIANAYWDIYVATAVIMVVMPIAMFISWKESGKISPTLWLSTFLVVVMGGVTIYLNDDRFIKIKPTVLYTFFSLLLFYGMLTGKHFLKYLFDQALPPMQERGWYFLTRNWAIFLMLKAITNEIVWRSFSTDFWVSFKLFVFVPITFIFFFAHFPMIMRYAKEPWPPEEDNKKAD